MRVVGSEREFFGLEWGINSSAPGGYQTFVSYVSSPVTVAGKTSYKLLRQVCTSGQATTPTSTTTVSSNLGATPSVFVCGAAGGGTPTTTNTNCGTFTDITSFYSTTWFSTEGVTKVSFNIAEPGVRGSSYSYQLVGIPSQGISQGSVTTTTVASTGNECEFAAAGTGTYASQLCFVDFTGFNGKKATTAATCQQLTGPIVNTPYSISFCLWAAPNVYNSSGGCNGYVASPVIPFEIPTYYSPGGGFNSEAFLGNNGFYTGLTENPALYQDVTTDGNPTHESPANSSCESQLSGDPHQQFRGPRCRGPGRVGLDPGDGGRRIDRQR